MKSFLVTMGYYELLWVTEGGLIFDFRFSIEHREGNAKGESEFNAKARSRRGAKREAENGDVVPADAGSRWSCSTNVHTTSVTGFEPIS